MPKDQGPIEGTPDIHKFFGKDPIEADRAFFGRETPVELDFLQVERI